VPHCSSVRVSMRYRFSATVLTCILLLGGLGIANGVVAKSDHGHELDQGHHQQSYHRSPGWFNEDEEIAELAGTPSNHESLRGSRPVREGAYFVDNEELDAKSPGLGYRASPVVKDKIGGVYAAWGSKVMGVDNGDGWLKTSNGYLPYYVHGKAVVVKFATPEEAGIVTHQSGREWWGHVNYNEAAENGMRSWEELERQQGHLGRWCTAHNHLKQCSVAFVCKAGFCSECTISRDCNEKHACEWDASAGHRICIPRSLTRSWTWRETVCTELIVVTALLSAAAGMGGGGVYVPLLLLLLGFSTKEAIPLSQAMIVGGAVVNFIMFCGERHPEHKHRPRIDYDVVMMLNPGLAAGVTLGVMCNLVTPQWFIVVILIFTLVLALQKSLGKGIQQFKKESQQLAEKAAKGQSAAPAGSVKIRFADIPSFFVLAQENSRPLSLIGGCWLVFLACNFIRAPSCTTAYWFQRLSLVGICLFFTISGQTTIRSRLSSKGTSEGMMGWTESTLWLYPLMATVAGFLGGFLGIGGGIIMGPLLLELGMDAPASQATTAMFVFLSSSLAAIQFMVLGKSMPEFALWFTAWVVVSTFAGQTVIDYILQRWQRSSLIVLSIAAIIAGSLCMMTAIGAKDIYVDIARGADMGFKPMNLCGH